MHYRITLAQTLPAQPPNAAYVTYHYRDGTTNWWHIDFVGPDTNTAVVIVDCAANLLNRHNVLSSTLDVHYAHPPHQMNIPISSVQPPLAQSSTLPATTGDAAMATPYAITITMNQTTVNALSTGGFYLYGFKAVKTTAVGAPVVWFETAAFGLTTQLSWSESYQAYTSTSQVVAGGEIVATNSYPIGLGQTLQVQTPAGTGTVNTQSGTAHAIDIANQTTTQFTSGISQSNPQGAVTPMCAFTLYGNFTDVIAPIEKVLLMFSTLPINTGTVVEQSYSPALLIDLTSENSRAVAFDINLGWSWGGGSWAQAYAANTDLVPLLIESSPSLARSYLAGLSAEAKQRDHQERVHHEMVARMPPAPSAAVMSPPKANGNGHGVQLDS
ncbi:MAG: hypothetical protein ACREE2_12880 [Stellaceae bacterium]